MKKILVGLFVLATFVIYSFNQRQTTTPASNTKSSHTASSTATNNTTPATSSVTTSYKDGSYTGSVEDAFYGMIQVKATINGGKLTDVEFLQYPNDRQNSIDINEQAMPVLKQEAIKAQAAQVDTISGATDTSQAFMESLSIALKAAQS